MSAHALPFSDAAVPCAKEAPWLRGLYWLFIGSCALDYRAAEGHGSGIDQMLFLAVCLASGMAIIALGWRYLTVRPGVFLILGWALFLAFMLGNSFLQGVPPGRSLRVGLSLLLFFFSLCATHVIACVGLRPVEIIRPLFIAACVNILWRIAQGFLFKGLTIENVRFEVQSPFNSWLCAWIACALLLRPRFHWSLFVACGVLFIGIFISITRSLAFPIFFAGAGAAFCFFLGARWGVFPWLSGIKRIVPIAAVGAFILLFLGVFTLLQPVVLERWQERIFHNADDRNLSTDISILTRAAEADAIMTILNEDPVHYINGRGLGATYYWHPAYLPEIWLVLPKKDTEVDEIWFAGHSIWTYGLFSGGVIAIAAYLAIFGWTMVNSLTSAKANAPVPGGDLWLAFLPFVATLCLLSETFTSNPFQERLTGMIYGVMAALPQAFLIRASWLPSLFCGRRS